MMQFKSFYWLIHHGILTIVPCSANIVSVRAILGVVFIFILVFYILGEFLIKQLLHSRLLDTRLL